MPAFGGLKDMSSRNRRNGKPNIAFIHGKWIDLSSGQEVTPSKVKPKK
jgi:hypothetical protein